MFCTTTLLFLHEFTEIHFTMWKSDMYNKCRRLLTFRPSVCTVDMGTSWTRSGHRILGSIPCWQSHALNFPGLQLSASHPNLCRPPEWMPHRSRSCQKPCQNFTGFSVIFRMVGQNLSSTFPLLSIMVFDFCWFETHLGTLHQLLKLLQDPPAAWEWLCCDCQVIHERLDWWLV